MGHGQWAVLPAGRARGYARGQGAEQARTGTHARSHAAQAFCDVFPHLVTATDCPKLVKIADVDYDSTDAIFCCLPHATTQVRPPRCACSRARCGHSSARHHTAAPSRRCSCAAGGAQQAAQAPEDRGPECRLPAEGHRHVHRVVRPACARSCNPAACIAPLAMSHGPVRQGGASPRAPHCLPAPCHALPRLAHARRCLPRLALPLLATPHTRRCLPAAGTATPTRLWRCRRRRCMASLSCTGSK